MFTFHFSRCFGIGMAAGIAVACTALPAFAEDAVMVSFQTNNPWTQEIGSVDSRHDSHDYSVDVAAGKTLQINLVTRDPNVFFKVTNETEDKQLVDTFKTGATTWSTQNPAAAKYTVHVYVDPNAMQRGEQAQYALQIGQYGQSDMRVPITTVTFEDKPWVQTTGTLDSTGAARDYGVAMTAGQTLAVNLVTRNPEVHFKVENQANGETLVDSATSDTVKWSAPIDTAATYTISVYADPASLPPGSRAGYALQIGHYATARPQPATSAAAVGTSASAAAPANVTAGAAMPASAATPHD